ncbi:MAG TPA: ornithine carbamoyltransferase, partial [Spirochaetota bacterium]|nr:ornithine carbamoyltransferase [Spirochaetota bacterium]
TDYNHPCEILGDLQFIRRKRGSLDGLNVVFAGEVTNLCMSWFEAAMKLPITVTQVSPARYHLSGEKLDMFNRNAKGRISVMDSLENAVDSSTDVIYTDSWPKDRDKSEIRSDFIPYQITKDIVDRMNPSGFFLPCPPVSRGEEISSDSLESDRYLNFEAKKYLLHAQNAVMSFLASE